MFAELNGHTFTIYSILIAFVKKKPIYILYNTAPKNGLILFIIIIITIIIIVTIIVTSITIIIVALDLKNL